MSNIYCFMLYMCFLFNKTFGKVCNEAYENHPVLYPLKNYVNNELERNTNEKSNDFKKMIDLFETINCKLDAFDQKQLAKLDENLHLKKTPAENMFPEMLLCKEVSVNGVFAQTYPMDSENFKFVTLTRNSTGEGLYFEMHIALETDERLAIMLLDNENIWDSDIRYYIDIGRENNQYTELQYKSQTLRRVSTPDLLSSTELRIFYIKIHNNGTLQFGKDGASSPLISYYDARFRFVNYFTFGTWGNEAKVRYDCPAPVEDLPCKEVSLGSNQHTSPNYSINNGTLNYGAVNINSTGHLTYFEAHIAVEAEATTFLRIMLLSKESHLETNIRYDIEVGRESNQYTIMDVKVGNSWTYNVRRAQTPDVLSPNQFRVFHLKIDDGKLELSKENDSSPLMSYTDVQLGSVKYFQFYYGGSEAKIRFDCPAPVEVCTIVTPSLTLIILCIAVLTDFKKGGGSLFGMVF